MSDLIWPDDLRERVKTAFPRDSRMRLALIKNDPVLVSLLNESYGWECSGVPRFFAELKAKLDKGEDASEQLNELAVRLERAGKIEELRQSAWQMLDDLLEGRPLAASSS